MRITTPHELMVHELEHDELATPLGATLDEEKDADQLRTGLAEGGINALAARDGSSKRNEELLEASMDRSASPAASSDSMKRSRTGAKRR